MRVAPMDSEENLQEMVKRAMDLPGVAEAVAVFEAAETAFLQYNSYAIVPRPPTICLSDSSS